MKKEGIIKRWRELVGESNSNQDDAPISVSEKLVKEEIRKLTQNSEEIRKLKEQVEPAWEL